MRQIPGAFLILSFLVTPAWPEPVRSAGRIEATDLPALTGRLVTPEGLPAAGVEIVVESLTAGRGSGERRATVDTEGRFRIAPLRPGPFVLRIDHPDFSRTSHSVWIPETTTLMDLGEIRLAPAATLEGEVVDEQGRPLQEAQMQLLQARTSVHDEATMLVYQSDARSPLATGAEGLFRFERLRAGLRFDLFVSHPGHPASYVSGVEVPRQEPLRIVLQTGRTLTGRVVDDAGRPVPGASVHRIRSMEAQRELERTDAEGRFELRLLKPGPLAFAANADGFLPQVVRLQIPEKGEPSSIEIVLDRGAAVAGRVLDEQGGPVAGATVQVYIVSFEGSLNQYKSVTDGAGRYQIEALPRGQHRITVESAEDRMLERGLEIGDSDIPAFDITLTSGFEVSGRVTDLQGAPATHVLISLYSSILGFMRNAQTGDDGFFRLPDVPEGRYLLEAGAAESDEMAPPQEVEVAGGPVTGLQVVLAPQPEKP
jgi:protocatechuate 3,4-dioxygenase beta subunit